MLFTPNKVGTWSVICNELCGEGHAQMRARLIIQTPPGLRGMGRQGTGHGPGREGQLVLVDRGAASDGSAHHDPRDRLQEPEELIDGNSRTNPRTDRTRARHGAPCPAAAVALVEARVRRVVSSIFAALGMTWFVRWAWGLTPLWNYEVYMTVIFAFMGIAFLIGIGCFD